MAPLKSSQQRIATLNKLIDELREVDRLREKVIVAALSARTLSEMNTLDIVLPNLDGRQGAIEGSGADDGGKYPDTMPQALRLVDAEGRSCIYVPITRDGVVVDCSGHLFDPEDDT